MDGLKPRYRIYERGLKGRRRAVMAMFGTIVGAGIFALPHAVERSGVLIALFWMIALAGASLLLHLLFAETVIATPGDHRLIGYIGLYLGRRARNVQTVTAVLGLVGGSLAYLILGGLFLSQLSAPFAPVEPFVWSLLLFAFSSVVAWKGANFLARVDFWLSFGLAAVLLVLIGRNVPEMRAEYLLTARTAEFFAPYGIILFAYGGLTAVSEMHVIVGRRAEHLRKSVAWGTLLAAGVTVLFAVTTVGVLGPDTSPEAIAGLAGRHGGIIPMLGAAAGFLAVVTSYIVFSLFLKEQFHYDFNWGNGPSWAAAMLPPFALFLLGVRSFGTVLEIVGGFLGGIQGVFVAMSYLRAGKAHPEAVRRFPGWLVWLLAAVFAAGAAYELIYRFV